MAEETPQVLKGTPVAFHDCFGGQPDDRAGTLPANSLGFMLSEGDSGPEKRKKSREFKLISAREIKSADRIAVPILSILGEECGDTDTVMATIVQMAQRTLFFTE